jgi:hypothetical protein
MATCSFVGVNVFIKVLLVITVGIAVGLALAAVTLASSLNHLEHLASHSSVLEDLVELHHVSDIVTTHLDSHSVAHVLVSASVRDLSLGLGLLLVSVFDSQSQLIERLGWVLFQNVADNVSRTLEEFLEVGDGG